jgi:ABC-type uncharacterized transport system substrate-binding protein
VVIAALACAGTAAPAAAHPHVWITVETTLLHEKGAFIGFRHKWTFDEFYTAMAIEGLDKNKDGKYDRQELAELAKINMDGLKEFSFFTFPTLAGQPLKTGEARDYWLEHNDGVLSLHFTLPLAKPVLTEAKAFGFSVQDPTYFIAFDFAKEDPVKLAAEIAKTCKVAFGAPAAQSGQASALNESFAALGSAAFAGAKSVAVDCAVP